MIHYLDNPSLEQILQKLQRIPLGCIRIHRVGETNLSNDFSNSATAISQRPDGCANLIQYFHLATPRQDQHSLKPAIRLIGNQPAHHVRGWRRDRIQTDQSLYHLREE